MYEAWEVELEGQREMRESCKEGIFRNCLGQPRLKYEPNVRVSRKRLATRARLEELKAGAWGFLFFHFLKRRTSGMLPNSCV